MGKLTYGMNVSIDGYIEDRNRDLGWTTPDDEVFQYFTDRVRSTSVALYGRRLYEGMAAHWPAAGQAPDVSAAHAEYSRVWCDMPKVVFSRTLTSVDWNSRLAQGDPVEVAKKLKAETDGIVEVVGATLAAPVVQAGLVDEFTIVVMPAAVGGGTSFIPELESWVKLRLLENRTFPSGVVLLRYEAVR